MVRWLLTTLAVCTFSTSHAQVAGDLAADVSTLAGSTMGSTNGTGTAASFNNPRGLAVDKNGNTYVADSENHRIRKITPAGVVSTFAGSGAQSSVDGTGTAASFFYPLDVAVDASGNVFVTELLGKKVRKITPAGVVSTLAGSGAYGSANGTGTAATFATPHGLAVDSSGNIYVADRDNHKIRKITPAGVVTNFAGSGLEGATNGAALSARFRSPHDVAVDASGNVYVADYYNYLIRKITAAGVVSTLAGTSGVWGSEEGIGTAASFYWPAGVAVDASGNVYVADAGNNKIRRITPTGTVSTVAGSKTSGNANGIGAAARFSSPWSLAFDTGGNLYVADSFNHRIRKGVLRTLQEITFPTIANRVMTSPTVSLSGAAAATASSGLPVTYALVSGPATLSGTTLTLTGEGTVTVRASQAGNAAYHVAPPVPRTFTVSRVSQNITFPAIGNRLLTAPVVALSGGAAATSTSGLPVTLAVISGPATLSGTTLTLTGEGTVTISASQAGNNVYTPASANQSFTVSRASQSIIFPAIANRVMSSPVVSLAGDAAATTSSGLPVSYSVSGPATLSGTTLTLTGQGTVTVTASQPGNAAYAAAVSVPRSFLVSRVSQTITFPAIGDRQMTDPVVSFTGAAAATTPSGLPITYLLLSGPASLSGTTLTLTGEGAVTIRAIQAGDSVYSPAPSVTQTFNVTRLSQSIIFSPIGDRTMASPTVSLTGPAAATASSELPVTYSVASGPATLNGTTLTLAGEGTVTVTANQSGNSVYSPATPVSQSFSVSRLSQQIQFPAIADQLMTNPSVSLTGPAAAVVSSDLPLVYFITSGPATVSGSTITLTGAGLVTVRASQPGNSTYTPAIPAERSFTVSRVPQTITFPPLANRLLQVPLNIALTASTTTGLPITFSVVSGPGTVSGSTLSVSAGGTITLKASQAGNSVYLPAEATTSVTITPNTSSPSSITLSENWFYDNAPANTVVGTVTAVDPDNGDQIAFSLVSGIGSQDNAGFSLIGGILRKTSTNFDYNTRRTATIRVRATDLAGNFIEQVIPLMLIDGTPSAQIIRKQVLPQQPAFVNVFFQLTDSQGFGINYPRGFLDSNPGLFLIEEQNSNGTFVPIGSESLAQVGKFDEIPSETKTVILIDASDSALNPILQNAVKAGVRALIARKIPKKQKIAIYAFAETLTLLQDFSDDATLLNDALNRVPTTGGSTDLYGAIISTLPRWNERFELTGIETGSMVVFTDGAHTFDAKTPQSVISAAAATSSSPAKQIYAVGLSSPDLDVNALTQISTPGRYFQAADTTQLVSKFEAVQSRIEDQANSIYWMNYYTAKRAGTAQVRIKLNGNSPATNWLDISFNATGFSTPERKIIVNRKVNNVDGDNDFEFETNGFDVADLLSFRGIPPSALTAVVDNPELVDVVRISATRFELRGKGLHGMTTLTVSDSAASLVPTRRLPVKIGTGIALPPQNIIFDALPDRVPTSPAFNLNAKASSLLPVTFSLVSGPATVSGNTVTLTGATGTVTIRSSQVGNASYAPAPSVDRSFTVASSGVLLNNWATSSGLTGTSAGPTATPYNDGTNNLLKYAFNMNAGGADVRILPTGGSAGLPQVVVAGTQVQPLLQVTFVRRKGSGVVYTPQRSSNLSTFVSMTGAQTVTSIDSQWERVSIAEPISPATTPRAFARVNVTLP